MYDPYEIKIDNRNNILFYGDKVETIERTGKLHGKHPKKEIYFAYCPKKEWLYIQNENNYEFYVRMHEVRGYISGWDIKEIDIKNMKDKDIHITLWDNKITRLDGVGHRIGGVIFEYDIDVYIGETKDWYEKEMNPIGECCW